mmetsp:Transcript_3149/g.4861  ORF Transcript_3149/g.4861 Transcript_3149/m.4861 type:complete len:388 (+) Transcript_3149:66-1229(+)
MMLEESGRILLESLWQWSEYFGENCSVSPTDSSSTTRQDQENRHSRQPQSQVPQQTNSNSLRRQTTKKSSGNPQHRSSSSRQVAAEPRAPVEYANDVANAKATANRLRLTRARTRTCKKEDIFRTKENTSAYSNRRSQSTPNYRRRTQTVIRPDNNYNSNHTQQHESNNCYATSDTNCSATSFGGVAQYALCFATPVRESSAEELREGTATIPIQKSESFEDESTLNTCEETITSTMYFDAKIAHLEETRPPMPLFNSYKVDTERSPNELQRIVSKDSHRSFDIHNSDNKDPYRNQKVFSRKHQQSNDSPTRPTTGGMSTPPRKHQPMSTQNTSHKMISKLDYTMADTTKHHRQKNVSTPMTASTTSSMCSSDMSASYVSTSTMAEI